MRGLSELKSQSAKAQTLNSLQQTPPPPFPQEKNWQGAPSDFSLGEGGLYTD